MHTTASALVNARPQLRAVRSAADALGLRPMELLHAGPPLADPHRPPATLRSSVVMACLHEGWVRTEAEAEALLLRGALQLSPAQDRACVTPLAAIVSAGTPLFEVGDGAAGKAGTAGLCTYAPVSAVRGADTRMGDRAAGLMARLQQRDTVIAPAIQALLASRGPSALWPLAAAGLAAGDDLHGSTAHANQAWVAWLRAQGALALADDIAATPLFFLTLWMAASALVLRLAEGGPDTTLVTRAGGNGERFAIALAARPGHWVACGAEPPSGPRLSGVDGGRAIEGAIGDSAVIDMLGLGGQRLAQAPDLLAVFKDHPLADRASLQAAPAQRLLRHPQALLPDAWPLGLDAAQVIAHQQPPRVMLAMLARDGLGGLCGRGIYQPPLTLFQQALDDSRRAQP